MHVLCLVLTGVCAVILFVGIGIGIVNGKDSNNSNIDYNEYGDDYAKDDDVPVVAAAFGGSIDAKSYNQGQRALSTMKILSLQYIPVFIWIAYLLFFQAS